MPHIEQPTNNLLMPVPGGNTPMQQRQNLRNYPKNTPGESPLKTGYSSKLIKPNN